MPKIGNDFPLSSISPMDLLAQSDVQNKLGSLAKAGQGKIDRELRPLGAKGVADPKAAKMEKAAQDFEALLLQEMLKSMWTATPHDDVLASNDEETYRDMFHQALAQNIAEHQSIGIKDVILKDLKRQSK